MIQPPNCTWDQVYVSATGKSNSKGTVTGTYTVQSNGSAVSQLTIATPTGKQTGSFAIVVPTAPLAVGQEVTLVGLPTLTNEIRGAGSAVRRQVAAATGRLLNLPHAVSQGIRQSYDGTCVPFSRND